MMRLLRALHARMHAHAEASDTGYEALAAGVAGVFLITLTLFGTPLWRTIAGGATHTAAVISAVLVDMANADRAAQGLGTLMPDPLLTAAAQAKATDMAQKSYFAHFDASGKAPWDWMHEAGYRYAHAGENLAIQFSESGDVQRAWLASPAHRANLLDGRFTQVGIATAEGFYQGQPTTFVVQFFGTPETVVYQEPALALDLPAPSDAEPAPEPSASESAVVVLGVSETARVETQEEKAEAAVPRAVPVSHQELPHAPTDAFAAATESAPAPRDIASAAEHLAADPWSTARGALGAGAALLALAFLYAALREFRASHARHVLYATSLSATCALAFLVADAAFLQSPRMPVTQSGIALHAAGAPARISSLVELPGQGGAPIQTTSLAFMEPRARAQHAAAGLAATPTPVLVVCAFLAIGLFALLKRRTTH